MLLAPVPAPVAGGIDTAAAHSAATCTHCRPGDRRAEKQAFEGGDAHIRGSSLSSSHRRVRGHTHHPLVRQPWLPASPLGASAGRWGGSSPRPPPLWGKPLDTAFCKPPVLTPHDSHLEGSPSLSHFPCPRTLPLLWVLGLSGPLQGHPPEPAPHPQRAAVLQRDHRERLRRGLRRCQTPASSCHPAKCRRPCLLCGDIAQRLWVVPGFLTGSGHAHGWPALCTATVTDNARGGTASPRGTGEGDGRGIVKKAAARARGDARPACGRGVGSELCAQTRPEVIARCYP